MIIALAGRRIDAPGIIPARFPAENETAVAQRIYQYLQNWKPSILVCSAACGADLLALEASQKLKLRRRIVLPSAPELFRNTSVTDRPGNWGDRFDQLIAEARKTGDLVVGVQTVGKAAYSATNRVLLDEALTIGKLSDDPVRVVVVWDGSAKPDHDYTAQFANQAHTLGLCVDEISTLE